MIEAIRRLLVIPSMQDRFTAFPNEQIARRWRDLADRRRSHFIELYESGRWKLYYSEADFIARMREVCEAAERWQKLASALQPDPADASPATAAASTAAPS